MERIWLLHTKNGNLLISESEAIEEAKKQEKEGIEPMYSWYDYKRKECVTPRGWLIWSTWKDGAGVAFKRKDGSFYVLTGWQGEFIYN